jgi:hypothetical protein
MRTINNKFIDLYIEEDFMKKLICIVSVVMMSLAVVGCGNSADGDKQKLTAPVSGLQM